MTPENNNEAVPVVLLNGKKVLVFSSPERFEDHGHLMPDEIAVIDMGDENFMMVKVNADGEQVQMGGDLSDQDVPSFVLKADDNVSLVLLQQWINITKIINAEDPAIAPAEEKLLEFQTFRQYNPLLGKPYQPDETETRGLLLINELADNLNRTGMQMKFSEIELKAETRVVLDQFNEVLVRGYDATQFELNRKRYVRERALALIQDAEALGLKVTFKLED